MAREEQTSNTNVSSDIRALNSSVLLLTQKLRFITRNEKILGRNIVVINKKISDLENKISSGQSGELQNIPDISLIKESIFQLQTEIENLKTGMVSKSEFQELKYLLESINPLEFVTLEQAKKLLSDSPAPVKKGRK